MANSNQDEYNKALQNLLTMSGKKVEIEKVWENVSPESAFPAQNLDIDAAGADFIIIQKNYSKTDLKIKEVDICVPNGSTFVLIQSAQAVFANVGYCTRSGSATETKLTFSDNYYKNMASTAAGTVNNGYQIPTVAYAVKGVI